MPGRQPEQLLGPVRLAGQRKALDQPVRAEQEAAAVAGSRARAGTPRPGPVGGRPDVEVRPLGGAAGWMTMLLISIIASVVLTVLLDLIFWATPARRPRPLRSAGGGRTITAVSDDYDRVEMTSRAQWRDWLEEHHGDTPGV